MAAASDDPGLQQEGDDAPADDDAAGDVASSSSDRRHLPVRRRCARVRCSRARARGFACPQGTGKAALFRWKERKFEDLQGLFVTQEYIQQLIRARARVRARCARPHALCGRRARSRQRGGHLPPARGPVAHHLDPRAPQVRGPPRRPAGARAPGRVCTRPAGARRRQMLLELNFLTVALDAVCCAETCPKMVATKDWEFLCAAHVRPKEVAGPRVAPVRLCLSLSRRSVVRSCCVVCPSKLVARRTIVRERARTQCCAMDYIVHTLNGFTALLNSVDVFPSRRARAVGRRAVCVLPREEICARVVPLVFRREMWTQVECAVHGAGSKSA